MELIIIPSRLFFLSVRMMAKTSSTYLFQKRKKLKSYSINRALDIDGAVLLLVDNFARNLTDIHKINTVIFFTQFVIYIYFT